MGKIFDALERHKKEGPIKLETVSREAPARVVQEDPEIRMTKALARHTSFRGKLLVLSSPESADAESFRMLKGLILYPKDRIRPRTIMVTSALPGEGKTHIAANLGASLALGMDEYVLLVDCDLRRPTLHQIFGCGKVEGLHELLVGKRDLQDVIVKTDIANLSILTAGIVNESPAELLSSNAMEEFVQEVKNRYRDRIVLLDCPPTGVAAETRILAEYVDGIILVVRAHSSPRKEVQKSIDTLGREKILGVVFNGCSETRRNYQRYYDRYYSRR